MSSQLQDKAQTGSANKNTGDRESDNVTSRNKIRRPARQDNDDFVIFRKEMKDWLRSFQQEQNEKMDKFHQQQKSKLDSMEKCITDMSSKISAIDSTSQDIEKSVEYISEKLNNVQTKINSLQSEWKSLFNQVQSLEDQHEFLAKTINKTSLEIRNIPKKDPATKSSLYDYVTKLCTNLNVTIQTNDIRDVTRVTNRKDTSMSNIIVEFTNTLHKNNILNAVKSYYKNHKNNRISSNFLGITGETSTIYISEYLTRKAKRLFYLAKDWVKTHEYKYCWVSNGYVYLRKHDGAPYKLINNEDQLMSLQNISI